jgi:hypothetical protein
LFPEVLVPVFRIVQMVEFRQLVVPVSRYRHFHLMVRVFFFSKMVYVPVRAGEDGFIRISVFL